jgi:hypothetical protein
MAPKDNQKAESSQSSFVIVMNISKDQYDCFLSNPKEARRLIDQQYELYPELFPEAMVNGYKLNGTSRLSKKLDLRLRKLVVGGKYYQIRPAFLLPHMRGETDDVADALFFLRFGVPFWGLAHVYGKYPMYWYRLYIAMGRNSLVGTTVRHPEQLPAHLAADEYHTKVNGEKAYGATTVAQGCILGIEVCESSSTEALQAGYGVFKKEALEVDPEYTPETVNTDGWASTQSSWKSLFPSIAIIECFLHAFIKVRDRATKSMKHCFNLLGDKIWDCYKAEKKQTFSQRIRRLGEWTKKNVPQSPMKENVLKLCNKRAQWSKYYDHPKSYRTSNMADRLMRFLDRHTFHSQKFHGTHKSATSNLRAYALIHNFTPSCPATVKKHEEKLSPAERLNGFRYHDDWLKNLMISTSMGGRRKKHRNPV